MSHIPDVVGVVVGLLAVLAIVASVAAFLKSQIGERTIALQKEEIDVLTRRNTTLKDDVIALTGRVQTVEAENRMLRTLVTQEQAIASLTEALASHHRASEDTWRRVLEMLERRDIRDAGGETRSGT